MGEQQHSGLRSLLLGNPPDNGSQNLESFSSVRQLVTVPADGTTAYLRWWHIHHTQEGVTDSPGRQEDRQDVILLAQNMQPMEISSRVRQNNGVWQESQVDLTNYIGKTFYIYFNAYNDGNQLPEYTTIHLCHTINASQHSSQINNEHAARCDD